MIAEVGDIANVRGSRMRDAVGAAETRQHADDHAKHDADEHQRQVERRQHDGETAQQRRQFLHVRPASGAARIAAGRLGALANERVDELAGGHRHVR